MSKTKIEELQKNLKTQERMRDNFLAKGKDGMVKKFEVNITKINDEIIALEESLKPKPKAKPKAEKTISGSMTQAECMKMLEKMRGSYLKSQSTTKKNIKSGKAVSDGSLKPSASLKNEAETIENKSDSGQKINKTEQKAIAFNIESIVKNCVEMIQYKKDANNLLKDLIRKLQELRADIDSGILRPGSQN